MNVTSSPGGVTTNTEDTPVITHSSNKRQASDSPTYQSPTTSRSQIEETNMSLTVEQFVALLSNSEVTSALQNLFQIAVAKLMSNAVDCIQVLEEDLAEEQQKLGNKIRKYKIWWQRIKPFELNRTS